jgi:hypothetical protein
MIHFIPRITGDYFPNVHLDIGVSNGKTMYVLQLDFKALCRYKASYPRAIFGVDTVYPELQ